MRRLAPALAVCAALCAGATRASPKRSATPAPAAPAASSDPSLTGPEYVAAGFPATDRAWSAADHVRAHEALAKLVAERGAAALPRHGSARSGAAFARMTDRGSFALVGDRSLPVGARISMAAQAADAVVKILKLYLDAAAAGGETPSAELLALGCTSFHAGRRLADLVPELPVPTAGSPERAAYDRGVGQLREGLATTIQGAFISLSDRSADPAARARFASCLADEIPPSLRHLGAETQAEVREQARRAAAAEPATSAAAPHLARLVAAVAPAR